MEVTTRVVTSATDRNLGSQMLSSTKLMPVEPCTTVGISGIKRSQHKNALHHVRDGRGGTGQAYSDADKGRTNPQEI